MGQICCEHCEVVYKVVGSIFDSFEAFLDHIVTDGVLATLLINNRTGEFLLKFLSLLLK